MEVKFPQNFPTSTWYLDQGSSTEEASLLLLCCSRKALPTGRGTRYPGTVLYQPGTWDCAPGGVLAIGRVKTGTVGESW